MYKSQLIAILIFLYTSTCLGEGEDLNPSKRYSSFVRIGKSPTEEAELRPEENKRLSSFVRIGKSTEADKRLSSFVRIGKSYLDDNPEAKNKRLSSFMRIGKAVVPYSDLVKRLSSFMRIGKNFPGNKRYSSFVRIGKDGNHEDQKRYRTKSSFVRIGKNYDGDVYHGYEVARRRPASSFVRIGKGLDGNEKRYSSFVRIGKNGNEFENQDMNVNEPNKRYSSFVRIGKNVETEGQQVLQDPEKRYSSFVRIGKSYDEPELETEIDKNSQIPESKYKLIKDVSSLENTPNDKLKSRRRKRSIGHEMPSKRGFIRIGKIPSSAFMRIGRNRLLDSLVFRNFARPSRRGHSSFIRIGKRLDPTENDEGIPMENGYEDNGYAQENLEPVWGELL